MSKRKGKVELPRDAHVVQALRRELQRNTRQISDAFWQEFEQIRAQQRNQLAQEHDDRLRITTLMQELNREAHQQADALIHTMSTHGINPSAPSPIMRKESEPENERQLPELPELPQLPNRVQEENPPLLNVVKKQNRNPLSRMLAKQLASTKPISKTTLASAASNLPRAPPTSRATMVPSSERTTPFISKLQLARKPK